ncbi:MAG: hypothetical protein ACLRMJ_03650 [Alistipes finegoldii]
MVRRRSGADRARRQRLHLHAARLPVFATQRSWQLPAYKQVETRCPPRSWAAKGLAPHPAASRLSSGLGFDGTIPMGYNAAGAMDYLAVRYNR